MSFPPAMLEKLAESGLDAGDAEKLCLTWQEDTSSLPHNYQRPGIKIPYFSPLGEPMQFRPGWPDFYRVRYLGEPKGFTPSEKKKRPPKYVQPIDSGMCAYFPPYFKWSGIVKDTGYCLILTEGEFKAAKGCREGMPTIGLGGVWNFRIAEFGVPLLQELADINWVKRRVYICYDSDIMSNPDIPAAAAALADTLYCRGAVVEISYLTEDATHGENGDG